MRVLEQRLIEIKNAVDEFLRRLQVWAMGRGNTVMPQPVEITLRRASEICDQHDLPASCQSLQLAVARIKEEYRGYTQREIGKIRPETGGPGPGFWAAAKVIARTRHELQTPASEKLEPVAVLLKQGVGHDQIARHIYGRRGVGPFMNQDGTPNIPLLEQEAAVANSVIAADWVPPWSLDHAHATQQRLTTQLAVFDKIETGRRYEDPATVEELLREGAFVQQIQRAKGVTRAEVLRVAAEIGVTAVEAPRFELRDPAEDPPELVSEEKAMIRQRVIDLYQQSAGEHGSAEIAAQLRQEGFNVTTNAVSAVIGHWKRREATAVGSE